MMCHEPPFLCPPSSRNSHVLAIFQSRNTVPGETVKTSAVSSTLREHRRTSVPRPGSCDHPVWITPRGHRWEQDVDVPNPRPENRLIERHANRIAAVAGVPAMAGMIDQDTPDDLGAESKEIGPAAALNPAGANQLKICFVGPRLRFEARSRGRRAIRRMSG
jgi:hypothetical protein